MKRLVLFDIDGTLLHGGTLWRECFEGAFQACFPDVVVKKVGFNGKTDPQICHELMGEKPLAAAQAYAQTYAMSNSVQMILDEYLDRVEKALPTRANEVEALPGTHDLLRELSNIAGLQLGLLTGNVRRGAKIKLRAAKMDHFFDFGEYGAFGDDHWDRYCLPRIAASRAMKRDGIEYRGKEIVVIGDTIHDVNCGKSIGVRSIAVGTGRNVDRAELLAAQPDHFFENLSDISAVLHAISS
ncbi:MAG: HAD family hydrolase [Bdellovibrionia bacterium]